jgi:4-cresol dehydrogenase (hydroxylating)
MDTVSSHMDFASGPPQVPVYPYAPAALEPIPATTSCDELGLRLIDDIAGTFLGVLPLRPSLGNRPNYSSAFRAWENLLGTEHVRFDSSTRNDYAKTTLPTGTKPAGVVRPQSVDEVQDVVRIARRFEIPLHAISRGKNWGYGDACAPADGYVIVDLGRMNHILEVNVELGYAVIEPGVTQGQMYEYIRRNNLPLLLDVTGAGPDASIVGNILQRGFGHTPYGDRFRHTSGFEVVLPDGRLIRTGFGRHGNAAAAHVFPWGNGPWIDGLFTQSDYGIVTSACIWLMPKPERIEGFAFKCNAVQLRETIEAIRRLRMSGTVRSTVHIANDLRVLSARTKYPWHLSQVGTSLSDAVRQQLRCEFGLGEWNVIGGLYGTKREVAAARATVKKELGRGSRVHYFSRQKLDLAALVLRRLRSIPLFKGLDNAVESARTVFDLLEGVPNRAHLQGAQWRSHSTNEGATPDIRATGLIWISPVIPMTGEYFPTVIDDLIATISGYGFDPLITLTSVTDRAVCCVTSINFDKECESESQRALVCAEALNGQLQSRGLHRYRSSSVPLKTT